jgi:hypothetical protein
MKNWFSQFRHDPVPSLIASGSKAVTYSVKRDLLIDNAEDIRKIWELPEAKKIFSVQQSSGCWKSKSSNRSLAPAVNYDLFETFRQISKLIEIYSLNRTHPSIQKAADYIFSRQTQEGDIRGILGDQYAPYYTGIIMSLLIKAGYEADPRVEKGFEWLLKMRQDDGGWLIGSPGVFGSYPKEEKRRLTTHPVGTKRDFDKTRPFNHTGTGMVIRAFAAHSKYRKTNEAEAIAMLLKSRFFRKDRSSSYQSAENWVNFKYPFFWTDLISALDSVSLIGIPKEDSDVQKALQWLIDNQQEDGLWKISYSKIHKAVENKATFEKRLWISFAVCRIFERYFGGYRTRKITRNNEAQPQA